MCGSDGGKQGRVLSTCRLVKLGDAKLQRTTFLVQIRWSYNGVIDSGTKDDVVRGEMLGRGSITLVLIPGASKMLSEKARLTSIAVTVPAKMIFRGVSLAVRQLMILNGRGSARTEMLA